MSFFGSLVALIVITSFPLTWHSQTRKETFWQKLLRIAGISATPRTQRAPGDELKTGNIWVAHVARGTRSVVTRDGGYRSPIFLPDNRTLLVLRGEDVLEIQLHGGTPRKLFTISGVIKLVGLSMDDPDKVLLVIKDKELHPSLGLLSLKSGQVIETFQEKGFEEYQRMVAHAQGWERVYNNGLTVVYVMNESKDDIAGRLEWIDVYLRRSGKGPINISRCEGDNCGQPSLSPDSSYVAYVRAER